MRFQFRSVIGFPLWLPILLGVLLFAAGQLVAGRVRATGGRPVRHNSAPRRRGMELKLAAQFNTEAVFLTRRGSGYET